VKRCFHGSLCLPSLGSFFGIVSNLGLWRRSYGKLHHVFNHILGNDYHDGFHVFRLRFRDFGRNVVDRLRYDDFQFFRKRQRYDNEQQLRFWPKPEFHVHLSRELAGWNGAAGIAVQFGRQYSAG